MAAGGDLRVRTVDKRESKVMKFLLESASCVRWDPTGQMMATTSDDMTTKALDFRIGKVIYTYRATIFEGKVLIIHTCVHDTPHQMDREIWVGLLL